MYHSRGRPGRMRFDGIDRVILFGGSALMVAAVRFLQGRGLDVRVYTAPRQAAEPIEDGRTLAELLGAIGQPFVVTDDINGEAGLRGEIGAGTLGLGLGEAWSFDEDLLRRFSGRL